MYRIVVSTHDVLFKLDLNVLRIHLEANLGLLVFDKGHHVVNKHAYYLLMWEFTMPRHAYFVNRATLGAARSLTSRAAYVTHE